MTKFPFVSLLLAGGVLLASGFAARAQFAVDDIIPDAPEREWVLEHCTTCHDLTPLMSMKLPAEGWEKQIHKMIGDTAPEDRVKAAAAYLARVLPPNLTGTNRHASHAEPAAAGSGGGVANYVPVTSEMLLRPPDEDWLMFSRTYDAQRFSPLTQINTGNVKSLALAWVRSVPDGILQSIPLVRQGIVYTIVPGDGVIAVDGANGDLVWEYRRTPSPFAQTAHQKALAIYQDVVVLTAADGNIVGLDASNGKVRWETYVGHGGHTSGAIMAGDKVISGRTCQMRADCFIAAHDPLTGKELWRFHTVPAAGQPGAETWGGADMERMVAAPWGLPGSYDPVRRIVYWGIANPSPFTRMGRNGGRYDATPFTAPAALYSNSTVALDVDTGKLKWYYQHLPGDDWDMDFTHDRTLVRVPFNPDPRHVKWISAGEKRGTLHDMVVAVGEGGGIFALDRSNGKFLWAAPFPYDVKNFLISSIDTKTGKTHINEALLGKAPDDHHIICFGNTRSYWPTAYSPLTQSLYVAYNDNCLDMKFKGPKGPQIRTYLLRPGSDPEKFGGIAKVNLSTGEIVRFGEQRYPSHGGILATAGNLIFHGDLNRRFRAYDARTGVKLWETILGGPITASTITYSADGTQYILVTTGGGIVAASVAAQAGLSLGTDHNSIYAFKIR